MVEGSQRKDGVSFYKMGTEVNRVINSNIRFKIKDRVYQLEKAVYS